ncbi:MAG: DNA mismatch repair protein MutS [Candidatus Coatesbacteria bacterium]|nr:MAG: DNA mismatch repair protein MutS [Candidatus Coatesbacteria bacterium]
MAENESDRNDLTPVMKQYYRLKARHRGEILFFRMGDFYETFGDDAKTAARVLGISLTTRDKRSDNPIPMAGVPYHSVEEYITKLLEAGYRVAIAEQMEPPSPRKKLVRREVVRVITPGTVIEEGSLRPEKNNYLISVFGEPENIALAVADVSTGELYVSLYKGSEAMEALRSELARLSPSEIILPDGFDENMVKDTDAAITFMGSEEYFIDRAYNNLIYSLGVTALDGFGIEREEEAIKALGVLFAYLKKTYKGNITHIKDLRVYRQTDYMMLDAETINHLELVEPARLSDGSATLFSVLDHTSTPMGKRLLRKWILSPLLDKDSIDERLSGVEELVNDRMKIDSLKRLLEGIYDLERINSRICLGTARPGDLVCLAQSILLLPDIASILSGCKSGILSKSSDDLMGLDEVAKLIESALVDDPPRVITDGGLIREGYSEELDRLKASISDSVEWIASLESKERKRTGIGNLKVGYNKVFGYYIEVSRGQIKNVPDEYIRKQTLKGAERYITPELKEREAEVLNAEERIKTLEYELFCRLRDEVASHSEGIIRASRAVARVDVIASLARTAYLHRYVRPIFTDDGGMEIRDGRHSVVERYYLREEFIPNDTVIDPEDAYLLIITGPNMSGKSTYLRQVALIVLMAQIGSFVPASKAVLPIVDRIFTRIGASDELSAGRSTFLVEMNESARILSHATKDSLILLDEIGRGTSTYDGISIAWAIGEYIHDHIGAKTLFATHYFELALLPKVLPRAKNLTVVVKEAGDKVVFLRKVVEGVTDRSYGIYVAQLAGLPKSVIERAREVLAILEGARDGFKSPLIKMLDSSVQLGLFVGDEEKLLEEVDEVKAGERKRRDKIALEFIETLKNLDLSKITPIDEMNILDNIKKDIGDA